MDGVQNCSFCSRSDATVEPANSHLREIIRELFSFWPEDVAIIACSDCFRTVEDFHAFYERVRENLSLLLCSTKASESLCKTEIKVEEMEVEWKTVAIDKTRTNEQKSSTKRGSKYAKVTSKSVTSLSENGSNDNTDQMELIQDGKFVVSQTLLESMASNFYSLQCRKCDEKFDKLFELTTHCTSVHNERSFVECCDKRIYRKKLIYQHMAKHLQPSAFQCSICNKDFANILVLETHKRVHMPEEKRKIFKCEMCNKSFTYKSKLKQHMFSHIPPDEKTFYKCEECSKTFDNYVSHREHIRSAHSAPKFLCPKCGKSFRLKANLTAHISIHSPEKTKRCAVCEKVFKTAGTLKQHMKGHGDFKYSCEHCEHTTYNISLLKQHMLKHSDEKPHACNVCGKEFKTKQNLKTHTAQHTGVRKYSCPYCPKTFAASGNFFTHRKRMHSEEHKNAQLAKSG